MFVLLKNKKRDPGFVLSILVHRELAVRRGAALARCVVHVAERALEVEGRGLARGRGRLRRHELGLAAAHDNGGLHGEKKIQNCACAHVGRMNKQEK